MLVKRDFETPPVQPDVEARGCGSGVRWLSRVTGISMRRRMDVHNAGTNITIPEETYNAETKEMGPQTEHKEQGEQLRNLKIVDAVPPWIRFPTLIAFVRCIPMYLRLKTG